MTQKIILILLLIMSAFTIVGCSDGKQKVKATSFSPVDSPVDIKLAPSCLGCGQLLGSAVGEASVVDYSIQLSLDFYRDSNYPDKVQVVGEMYVGTSQSISVCPIPAGTYKVTTIQAGERSFAAIKGLILQASGPVQIELSGDEITFESTEPIEDCSGNSYSYGFSWKNGHVVSVDDESCGSFLQLIPPPDRFFCPITQSI